MTGFSLGWRQVACCFVLLTCSGSIAGSYGTLAGPLGAAFHPSRGVLMLAMTVMAGVSGLLIAFLGDMMDRVSMRRVMVTGAILLAAGYAALSQITSFTHALIVFGVIVAPATVLIGPVAATVLISRWFVEKRGMAIGIAIAGVGMGTILFPPILQGLFDHFDWRTAFLLAGLLMLAMALPAALLVVDSPADRGLHPDGAATDLAASAANKPRVPVLTILSDPAFWIAAGIFVVVTSGMKGTATNLQPMAMDVGIKPFVAASLVSIYGVAALVAKLGFAMLADRVPPRRLMFAGLTGYAGGMACLANAAAGYGMIAAGVICVGLAGGIMTPLQSYLIPRIFGTQNVGRAYGLMSTALFVPLMATPPIFGGIYDLTGSYSAIFLTFIALAACALIAVPYLRLHPRQSG